MAGKAEEEAIVGYRDQRQRSQAPDPVRSERQAIYVAVHQFRAPGNSLGM